MALYLQVDRLPSCVLGLRNQDSLFLTLTGKDLTPLVILFYLHVTRLDEKSFTSFLMKENCATTLKK